MSEFETRCIHLDTEHELENPFGAISFPIFQSATYAHPGVGQSTGYDYSRLQNPTRDHLERIVAQLEGGIDAFALSSGMAAISLMMELFQPGDHIIIDADLYGGSIRLFHHISEKNGIEFTKVNFSKEDPEPLIRPNTKAFYVETPTNPMMNVTDLEKLSGLAKKHGLLTIVDNTFLSPYLLNPLALGADIVVHSGTKYLGGHNDTLAGFIIVKDEKIQERLRFYIKTTGAGLAPFDCFLIERGIKTLPVRMDRAQENAAKLANWLKQEPYIKRVIYPGLPEHPGHEIMKRQARGFGAMLTFEMDSKEHALAVLEKIKLIQYAESLGGPETLLTYPTTQTHADVPVEERVANGITESVLRLSAGLESAEDLIADLKQAFESLD